MTDQNTENPLNVTKLIDQLLDAKDPAEVGLKRILRRKVDLANDFPLKTPELEVFGTSQKKSVLNVDERRVLEVEKRIAELEKEINQKEESARKAVQDAYLKGKELGIKEGFKKGKDESDSVHAAEIEKIKNQVSNTLETLESSRKELIRNSEHTLLRLCIQIVKKIIANEVSCNREIINGVLKKSLAAIAQKDKLIIRLSPLDLEAVQEGKEFWGTVTERLKEVIIEEDERIERGGCIIESGSGLVDARLGVQVEEVAGILETMWRSDTSDD